MSLNIELIWWIAQIAIDITLLAAVFMLAGRQKKQKKLGQAPLAAEDFVEQAGGLAREFDRLLGEKRELVGTTLATLDARIAELRAMLEQARALQEKAVQEKAVQEKTRPMKASSEDLFKTVEDPFDLPPGHPLSQLKEKPEENPEEFRGQVMKLLGQGRSPQEIANATGRPRAEVELLIALIK